MKCEDDVCSTDVVTTEAGEVMTENVSAGKLIYFGDPMCSWCWGITKHLEKLREEFKERNLKID